MSDSQYDTGIGPLMAKVLEQQREIARLTAERDEARRMACELDSWLHREYGNTDPARFGSAALAAARGWGYLRLPDSDALDRLAKLDEECGL